MVNLWQMGIKPFNIVSIRDIYLCERILSSKKEASKAATALFLSRDNPRVPVDVSFRRACKLTQEAAIILCSRYVARETRNNVRGIFQGPSGFPVGPGTPFFFFLLLLLADRFPPETQRWDEPFVFVASGNVSSERAGTRAKSYRVKIQGNLSSWKPSGLQRSLHNILKEQR